MNISILGASVTKFGELWSVSPRELAKNAFEEALEASNIKPQDLDALFVGNMLSGILESQVNLG
mgnify:CR=1 FL=1